MLDADAIRPSSPEGRVESLLPLAHFFGDRQKSQPRGGKSFWLARAESGHLLLSRSWQAKVRTDLSKACSVGRRPPCRFRDPLEDRRAFFPRDRMSATRPGARRSAAMARFGFPITIKRGKSTDQTRIHVDKPLDRLGLPGMSLKSSGVRAPLTDHARLPDGLGGSIDDRLRRTGTTKGRVLAIWQGDQVVAACAWHLHESGPIVIFDLGCRTDLDTSAANRARTALLLCLRDIADELGRGTDILRWTDLPTERLPGKRERARVRGAIRQRADDLGFQRNPSPRPKWLRKKWAKDRKF